MRANAPARPEQTQNQHSAPPFDMPLIESYLSIMEGQKERVRVLLSVIRDLVPEEDTNLDTLVGLAEKVIADHGYWYDLYKALGIEEVKANV